MLNDLESSWFRTVALFVCMQGIKAWRQLSHAQAVAAVAQSSTLTPQKPQNPTQHLCSKTLLYAVSCIALHAVSYSQLLAHQYRQLE